VKIGDPSVDLWEDHAVLADNYEWLSKLRVIPFLRDVGKHFPLGAMIAKESVRSRVERIQWGDITAGVELIRRVRGAALYGMPRP
jgi:tyrosyl-tRNA synthetase